MRVPGLSICYVFATFLIPSFAAVSFLQAEPFLQVVDVTKIEKVDSAVIISKFDGGANVEWQLTSNIGAIADDSVNILDGHKSIQISSSDNGSTTIDKKITAKLDGFKTIFVKFYVDNIDNVSSLVLYFSNSNFSSYFSRYLALRNAAVNKDQIKSGWNEWAISQYQFGEYDKPNWTSIDRVRLLVRAKAGKTVIASFSSIVAYRNVLNKGIVIFNFDDGNECQFDEAKRIMDRYKFPGVDFINANSIGHSGFCTVDQLRIMQDSSGWDIGNHTYSHKVLTSISNPEVEEELNKNAAFMQNNGLKRYDILAYPTGQFNNSIIPTIKKDIILARGTDNMQGNCETYPIINPLKLRSTEIQNTMDLSTVEKIIDEAETNKVPLILTFHKLVPSPSVSYEWPISDFRSLIEYVSTKDVEVLNYTQLQNKIKKDETGPIENRYPVNSEIIIVNQNYPNPFNPITTISYEIKEDLFVKVGISDILGREIKVLVSEYEKAGNHEVKFYAKDLPSGTYFYSIHAGQYIQTRKMSFLK